MKRYYAMVIALILSVFVIIGCNTGTNVGTPDWPSFSASTNIGTVAGSVVDSLSTPVASATVKILSTPYGTSTDKQGLYTIYNVPGGSYQVRISKTGYLDFLGSVTIVPEDTVQIPSAMLESDVGELTGKVVDESTKGLGSVTIQIYSETDLTKLATSTFTEDGIIHPPLEIGTFHVKLSSGTYSLVALKDTYQKEILTGLVVQIKQPSILPQDIVLKK